MMKKKEKRKRGIARLLEIAGTKKGWLLTSMALAIIGSVAQFVPFVAVYNILVELAGKASDPTMIDQSIVWHWSFVSLGAIIVYGLLLYASLMCSHIAAFNILYELRMQLAQKLVRLPMGFFTKRASGGIKKVMQEDVERIELFVAHHIPDITSAIVFPLLIIGYMFYSDWRLALIVVIVFAVSMAVMSSAMGGERLRKWTTRFHETLERMNNSIVEYVRGIQVVKVFNRTTNAFERLRKDIDDYRDSCIACTNQYAPSYLTFYILISSVLLFLIPVILYLLLHAASYPAYIPTAFLFLILGGGVFFPLLKLMWIGGLMNQNTLGVEEIDAILQKPEITEVEYTRQPSDASVVFDRVCFSYTEGVNILKDVSFTAKPGTVTAFVGPSGAGKSTIVMLAARFWDVTSGEIRMGGTPIREMATSCLMDHIAYVFQDNMMFFDTIEENIRMGNRKATHEEVVSAAKAAQCHEFIEKLEQGYQTLVGEGGTYLSGGEQQRISLARAILKDAPVILLDEATAYADPENEGKILSSFSHLIKGKTVLVIAHRLSTITNADRIMVIDGGQVIEQGTHQELLALHKRYAHMWEVYSQSREWVMTKKEDEK